jgi:hypothetical protein
MPEFKKKVKIFVKFIKFAKNGLFQAASYRLNSAIIGVWSLGFSVVRG